MLERSIFVDAPVIITPNCIDVHNHGLIFPAKRTCVAVHISFRWLVPNHSMLHILHLIRSMDSLCFDRLVLCSLLEIFFGDNKNHKVDYINRPTLRCHALLDSLPWIVQIFSLDEVEPVCSPLFPCPLMSTRRAVKAAEIIEAHST